MKQETYEKYTQPDAPLLFADISVKFTLA